MERVHLDFLLGHLALLPENHLGVGDVHVGSLVILVELLVQSVQVLQQVDLESLGVLLRRRD